MPAPAVLQFRVECGSTKPGEAVYVVGSAPELGAWKVEKGVPCITTAQAFPKWTSPDVPVRNPGDCEFKVVVSKANGEGAKWEGGGNKKVDLKDVAGKLMVIRCAYGRDGVQSETSKLPDHLSSVQEEPETTIEQEIPLSVSVERKSSVRMNRQRSRHILQNVDGSLNLAMTSTPSLMMIDPDEFFDEAEAYVSKLDELEKERDRLNADMRRMASGTLLQGMHAITDFADPSSTVMLQGFNWESWKAGKGNWYGIIASKVEQLAKIGITDIWLPPCSASVAEQGYLPSQLFNLDGSKYGNKESLKALLKKLHENGMRGVADIVINHRCGDKQDSQGRWNVFTNTGIEHRESFAGVMDWQGWAITLGDKFSDGSGERGPGKYDGKFDAAPDIDHGNKKVQESIKVWMRWLRLEVGFDAWRFDFVKGYGSDYVGLYCDKTNPAWAVGELWLDMNYDEGGLAYNQDKHRQDTINWIKGTKQLSTAFDFTTKGILQEAVRNCQYWRLKDSRGKPPGVIGWMPTHAVTFLDNHDTGSTQQHWPFPSDKMMVGYAYILTHPGIPSIFWDHMMDWGDEMRNKLTDLIRLRRESGIPVDAFINIKCAENDLYIAEIGEHGKPAALRVALGPRDSGVDGNRWQHGSSGNCWKVWISKEAQQAGKARDADDAVKKAEAMAKTVQAEATTQSKEEEARMLAEYKKEEDERKKAAAEAKAAAGAKAAAEAKEAAAAAAKADADAKAKADVDAKAVPGAALVTDAKAPAFTPPKRPSLNRQGSMSAADPCLKLRSPKGLDPSASIVVCGEVVSLGSWNPASASPMEKVEDLWVLPDKPDGIHAGVLYKFVVISPGKPPKWEGRENRRWPEAEAPMVVNIFDSMNPERPKKPKGEAKKLEGSSSSVEEFIERLVDENQERPSYRLKLELPKVLLEDDHLKSLADLALVQAYLTFVASGQVKCQEDGRHNRPCAAANAAKFVTEALWEMAGAGDAERFIARRIFPSLPSFSDEFTCAVPMTRIRDIAHRNDIPHDMKLYIKHELQNKLHRCADPGDLVKLDQLVERIDREGGYNESFVRELKIFQVELRDFFNATGLDDSAKQIAKEDSSLGSRVDRLLGLKAKNGDAFEQLLALTDLRQGIVPKVEQEQNWLRLDVELEKYAFVLLSQVAQSFESGQRGSGDWWRQLLKALTVALRQIELSGLSVAECVAVTSEVEAEGLDVADASKAPFAPQRLVASMDRALRICFALTSSLEAAYAGVPALGKALNIDAHAVSVFVEAELRASVLFQVSKLAQLAMQQAKVSAGLPLWTAISAGTALGRCMFLNALSEAWSTTLPKEGAVIFCNEASGDEEVPNLVRGVVVGRDLPVLSHLALRARQLNVIFSCTSEALLFTNLKAKAKKDQAVKLVVEASGGTHVEVVSDAELAKNAPLAEDPKAKDPAKAPKLGELSMKEDKVCNAIDLADKSQVAGGKAASSGKLEKLAKEIGFMAPKGLAIPFGVMKKSIKGAAFETALGDLEKALASNSKDIEAKALAVRAAVESCEVPAAITEGIMAGLPDAERVAVRSSANSEDLEKVSGAGLHDSVLGVDAKDRSSISKAILQVWSSMFTLRAVQSRHAAGMPLYEGIAMGVLVQPMVSRAAATTYAFIAFSKDAVAKDDKSVSMELCVGLGETLASANEPGTPYRLTVQKNAPNAVKITSLASFSFGLQDKPGGPQKVRIDYSKEALSTDKASLEKLAQEVAAVAVGIEKGYGVPMDMEGVVLEREGGKREIHLVQARPIVE